MRRHLSSSLILLPAWWLAVAAAPVGAADPPPPAVGPRHFVFFELERERIREASFLENDACAGAQLKYTWRELEPEKDRYDLALIARDLEFLERHGKTLFVQLQDVSFSPDRVNVPEYLLKEPRFNGGAVLQYRVADDDESTARPEGWVARRWDPAVIDRYTSLLRVIAARFDGRIEGLNTAETAVEFGTSGKLYPAGFTPDVYRDAMKTMMTDAGAAFSESTFIVYANFMPGEWRPWNDRGLLESIYLHAHAAGVGVGAPDLTPGRKGQQNHAYALVRERAEGVRAGIAVQWGNYEETDPGTGEQITVGALHAFARDVLRLDYVFWCTQEPFYSRDVLPYLERTRAIPD